MRHVADSLLRARADRELDAAETIAVERHLASCGKCREQAGQIAARARAFEELFPTGDRPSPDTSAAFTRFQARRREQERPSRAILPVSWIAGLAAASLIVLLFASGPTRATAKKLLGIFRAKTVVAVPLKEDFLANGKGQLLSEMLSADAVTTRDEKPQEAANRQQASEWAGFAVRLPSVRRDAPRILRVEGARSFHLTVDMKRVEAFFDLVRNPGLRLPPNLAGARVSVEIPRGVKAVYGECPDTPAAQVETSRLLSCLQVIQSPAATVTTQPELDLRQIAGIGLRLSGMSAEQAEAFDRAIDWTSTAAVPLPTELAAYRDVRVQGAPAVLVLGRPYANWPSRWSLIWVDHERVYNLGGFGDPGQAIAIAESLQ